MPLVLPRVIGHRGAAFHAPENTLAGIRRAAALGVGMVEVDVKLTRDRVPVLMHDDMLDRTTDGSGPVAATDFATIRTLDAGRGFGAAFAGEKVPTLEEALALVLALGLAVNVELKPCPGRTVETAEIALGRAQAVWPAAAPPPFVSSFEIECLATARRVAPGWPRGYLIWDRPADWAAIAEALESATLNVSADRETPETIAAYRATGRPVLAYTVNDPVRAQALFALGIAAVFSDAPDRILAVA
jgi:glycerophosphoryl diester phosphodiesterase